MALRKTKAEAFPHISEDMAEFAIYRELGEALKAKDEIVKRVNALMIL